MRYLCTRFSWRGKVYDSENLEQGLRIAYHLELPDVHYILRTYLYTPHLFGQ